MNGCSGIIDRHELTSFFLSCVSYSMIKSRSSQTAAAAFSLIGVNRWALSGTPLQNRVGELYSLIRFLRIDPMAHYFCRSKVSLRIFWVISMLTAKCWRWSSYFLRLHDKRAATAKASIIVSRMENVRIATTGVFSTFLTLTSMCLILSKEMDTVVTDAWQCLSSKRKCLISAFCDERRKHALKT